MIARFRNDLGAKLIRFGFWLMSEDKIPHLFIRLGHIVTKDPAPEPNFVSRGRNR